MNQLSGCSYAVYAVRSGMTASAGMDASPLLTQVGTFWVGREHLVERHELVALRLEGLDDAGQRNHVARAVAAAVMHEDDGAVVA